MIEHPFLAKFLYTFPGQFFMSCNAGHWQQLPTQIHFKIFTPVSQMEWCSWRSGIKKIPTGFWRGKTGSESGFSSPCSSLSSIGICMRLVLATKISACNISSIGRWLSLMLCPTLAALALLPTVRSTSIRTQIQRKSCCNFHSLWSCQRIQTFLSQTPISAVVILSQKLSFLPKIYYDWLKIELVKKDNNVAKLCIFPLGLRD